MKSSIKILIKNFLRKLIRSRIVILNSWIVPEIKLLKRFKLENELIFTWHIFRYEVYMNLNLKSYIDQQLAFNKNYTKNINFHILKNISPDTTFLDIGSNIGTTSLPAATAFRSVDVHCFEPNPTINKKLEENIALNSLDNVCIHDIGISNEKSVRKFYFPKQNFGNLGTSSLHKNDDIIDPIETEISLCTIDDLYVGYPKPISVIKIDVQGHELEVLTGAIKTINKFKPVIIFEHEDRYQKHSHNRKVSLKDFFEANDYKVFEIDRYDYRILRYIDWDVEMNANLIALPNRKYNSFDGHRHNNNR